VKIFYFSLLKFYIAKIEMFCVYSLNDRFVF